MSCGSLARLFDSPTGHNWRKTMLSNWTIEDWATYDARLDGQDVREFGFPEDDEEEECEFDA